MHQRDIKRGVPRRAQREHSEREIEGSKLGVRTEPLAQQARKAPRPGETSRKLMPGLTSSNPTMSARLCRMSMPVRSRPSTRSENS